MPASENYRFSLKSLLLASSYLSVGLLASLPPASLPAAVVSDFVLLMWLLLSACYYAIACALAMGLARQVQYLGALRCKSRMLQGASLNCAIGWRAVVCATLVGCLLLKIALVRQWLLHPSQQMYERYFGYADGDADTVLLLSSLAALHLNVRRSERWSSLWQHRIARYLLLSLSLIATTAVLIGFQLIPYLVYKALAGIEQNHKPQFWRPGAYLDPQDVGYQHFWLACAGFAALLMGATLWIKSVADANRRTLYIAAGTVGLAASSAYAYWFYAVGGPTLAPDFAYVGLQSYWWHWLEATVILVLFIPLAAYRMAQTDESLDSSASTDPILDFPLNVPVIILGSAGCLVVGTYTIYILIRDYFASSGYLSAGKYLWLTLTDYPYYLPVAMALVLLKLSWLIIRRQELQAAVPSIDGSKLAWYCIVLSVLIPIAIPTIAAFGFSMWLSPWLHG